MDVFTLALIGIGLYALGKKPTSDPATGVPVPTGYALTDSGA